MYTLTLLKSPKKHSMALVAYDNSDASDCEEEDCDNTTVVLLNKQLELKSSLKLPAPVQKEVEVEPQEITETAAITLFNFLPQPSTKKPSVVEEDDEFLHKKEDANTVKPKAKITVPSLNDFKDVKASIPMTKRKIPNEKKSGLLSLLPQPRNGVTTTTKSLIPDILKKKSAFVKREPPPTPLKKAKVISAPLINDYSDDSDSEEVQNDFFSINKPIDLPTDVDMPLDIEQNTNTQISDNTQQRRGIESFFKKDNDYIQLQPDYNSNDTEDQSVTGSTYHDHGSENSNNDEVVLDEEAILKLCGARGKRKREEIHIVDVNQQEVLANAREMLLKGLMDDTTKRVSASKRKGNEPTSQQKRKHQITYLAYQAKANEAELQNQWSNNRMSKKQTQAKYGF